MEDSQSDSFEINQDVNQAIPKVRQFYDAEVERQMADKYFNQKAEQKQISDKHLKHFGTIHSVVGTTAVIKALPTFDLIESAVVKSGSCVGEIFDLMGEQFNPLYVARFSCQVEEGCEVLIDTQSIVRAEVE